MKKRFLSILMCAAMVLTLLPTTVLAADPTGYWTDTGNVGTLPVPVGDVYTITSAAELAAVAKAVNEQTNDFSGKTILLAGDIDLSAHLWVPIGSSYRSSFRGSFNGAGHAIRGLTIQTNTDAYVGLFGYIIGGTYSDVTVNGSVSVEQDDYTYVGGLIGCVSNSSGDSTKLRNVTTEVDISGMSYYNAYFGGMMGYGKYCEFENCTASGAVSGTLTDDNNLYLGGMAGYSENCDFENCTASGDVSNTACDGYNFFIGGLIGYASNYNADTSLKNSYATGKVTGTASGNHEVYVGGLVGQNYHVPVKNCYATGAVNASSAYGKVYVGGLAGCSSGAVDGCYATGTVTGRSDYPDTVYAGGLVGVNYAAVNHSYATGGVTATRGDAACCGGFVGDNNASIYNSYAKGSVNASSYYSGTDAVGGSFAGRNNEEIINCCALGNVTVKGNDQTIGGVFLGIANVNSSVRNCYAVGSVTSSATSGTTVTNGFAGVVKTASYTSDSDGEISHCIYRENDITPVNGETKTESVMKSAAFADELNEWFNTYDGLETPLSFWTQSGTDYPVFDEDASPAVSYDIWLGGVRITSINCDDITAAINMKTPGAASGSAVYTPASGDSPAVLTLSDFRFSGEGYHISWKDSYRTADVYYGLCTKSDLAVILSGDNSITETSAGPANGLISCGISNVTEPSGYIYGDITLTFSGSGSLTAAGADSNVSKYDRSTGSYGIYVRGDIVLKDTVSVTGIGGDVSSKAEENHPGWTSEKDIDTYGIRASSVSVPDGTACKGIGGDVSLLDDLAETADSYELYGRSTGIQAQFGTMAGTLCGIGGSITLNDTEFRSDSYRILNGTSCGLRVDWLNNFTGSVSAAGGSITLEGHAADNPGDSASSSGFDQQTGMSSRSTFSGPLTICGNTAAIMENYRNISASGFHDISANYSNTQLLANTENSAEGAAASPLTTGIFPTGDGVNVYKYISIAPLYTVTVENDGNGTVEADKTAAAAGETITLTATPNSGYHFKEWQSSDVTISGNTFTMPEKNVTVTAIFEADETGAYTVTFDANGGSVTPATATTGADGTLASLPAPTRNGSYSFVGWYTAASGGIKITAEKVYTADTAIYAHWAGPLSFADLPTGVSDITVSEGDEEIGTAIKDAFVLYCKDNIKADGEYAFIDYRFEDGGTFYHTWIVKIQSGTVTAEDGGSSNLAGVLYAVNNPIYDWWINGAYSAIHTVTVENDGNGSASADKTSAAKGDTVTLTATPAAGYHFKEWQSSDVTVSSNTFTMPEKNVTVTAIFEADETGAYTVTFDANDGSVTPAKATTGADGTLTSLPAPTRSGYRFVGWYTEANGGTVVDTATVFTADTTIYAHWAKISGSSSAPATFESTVADSTHGSVSISKNNAQAGEIVTIHVNPDQGYTLETITVTDRNGKNIPVTADDGKYTFTMPASKVTIAATFMEDNTMLNFFVDVPADAYSYDAVLWAVENGITLGTDDTHFSPDLTCTRAQVVTFLWRAVGCPEVEGEMNFTDVVKGSYYEKAVAWAVAEGITKGTSETTFSPDATCNRGQIGAFLWRAAGSPAMLNMTAAGPAVGSNPFRDVATTDYYYQAVLWAVKNGITHGTTATTFSPNAECTRAQIVTFLYRNMGK